MHRRVGLAALLVAGVLALPLGAQQQASSFMTGVAPGAIQFTPIDVNRASRAFNTSQIIRPPSPQTPLNLGSLFPKFSMPSWPPRIGYSNVPQATLAKRKPKTK